MAKQDDYVRITLRLPPDLHEDLVRKAGANSLNAEIVSLLSAREKTPRDEIAMAALMGLYASRDLQMATLHDAGGAGQGNFEEVMAKQAYRQADAMIAARGEVT